MDFLLVGLFMLATLLTALVIAYPLEERGGDTHAKGSE